MAHTVVRGVPTTAQLYLEEIIRHLVQETGREEDRFSLSRILYKSLRDQPPAVTIIDGKKDTSLTNKELLQSSVQVARALTAHGVSVGDVAVLIGWNHTEYIATHLGALFAGAAVFCVETVLTGSELKYYFKLLKPKIVFVDESKAADVQFVLQAEIPDCLVVIFGNDAKDNSLTFENFTKDNSRDYENYWPVELNKDAVAMLFTTGGTTGLGPPKVVPITHAGLVAQAPSEWRFSEKFPMDNELCLLLFNGQWLVHTMTIVSAIIYQAKVLVQSQRPNAENSIYLLKKYKPTWLIIDPTELTNIVRSRDYEHGVLHCLDTLVTVGLNPYKDFIARLKREVQPETLICNRYGMTEAHGYICHGDRSVLPSVGSVSNIFEYKLVGEDGRTVQPHNSGELYLKSKYSLPKTYFGDEEAARNMYTSDGWFKTGDILVENERGEMRFVDRSKCIIYNLAYPISPQELEETICLVPGVAAAVACSTDAGPAALVVPREGMHPTREEIMQVFKDNLSEYKHLTGGIAFVKSLPRTHVGKIHRRKCAEIIKELIKTKECY